ncbi:uncharacterized protein [Nicotiana tomentosiformis]|uniref:uncharacterized protein n=1 Tax=Nicotiana tomentosiformis TaxID=4098 RepID=UPI00388C3602
MYHDIRGIYWCDEMKKDITEFVTQCPNCQQVKIEHQKLSGLFQAIEIPTWKWEVINMDFIIGLPRTQRKFDAIWVIVDRLTNAAHFLSTRTTYSAEDYARLYIREIVRLHGVPISIISYRGQSRQKSYANNRRRDLEFQVDDWVFLKVSQMKGAMRFGKKGKLSPRCIGDPSKVILVDDVQFTEQLSDEEALIVILDRQVRRLRTKDVASVKVLWINNNAEDMTWEAEEEMKTRYPHLFPLP